MNFNELNLILNTHLSGFSLAEFRSVIFEMCFGMFAARGIPFMFAAKEDKSENRLSTASVETDQ